MASSQTTNKDTTALLDYAKHVLIYVERMRNDESSHDVVFIVENVRFPAHRYLMAAASPVLRNMLTNGMKETYQREIPLKEVYADVWGGVVDYVYTGQMDLVNVENALRYLECAERFQMKELEEVISRYIKQQIDVSNCFQVLATVDRIDCASLRRKAMKTLANNFHRVYHTSEFAKLPYNLVLKILRRRELMVRSEVDVFAAALHWFLDSAVNRVESGLNMEIWRRACEMLKESDLGIDAFENAEPGIVHTGDYSELFECVDINNLSDVDLGRVARFCRNLCKETRETNNVTLIHVRQVSEKLVDFLLAPHNLIPSVPIAPCNRVPHFRYDAAVISADGEEFAFVHVICNYRNLEEEKVYSTWHQFAGFRWRLLIFPRGNRTKNCFSAYLECGGPVVPDNSDVDDYDSSSTELSSDSSSQSWTCPVHFHLHLVHPSRWNEAGVTLTDLRGTIDSSTGSATINQDSLNAVDGANNITLPQQHGDVLGDIIKDTAHVFCMYKSDWGFCEFVPFNTLNPGLHCDANYNVVVKVRMRIEESDDA